jgi:hypothetical protein
MEAPVTPFVRSPIAAEMVISADGNFMLISVSKKESDRGRQSNDFPYDQER